MNSLDKVLGGRSRIAAFELELTKEPDGKLRHFRFTVGAVALRAASVLFMPSNPGIRRSPVRSIEVDCDTEVTTPSRR